MWDSSHTHTYHTINQIEASQSINPKTIRRISLRGKASQDENSVANVSQKFPKNAGRKKVQIDINKILEIPFRRRTNIQ